MFRNLNPKMKAVFAKKQQLFDWDFELKNVYASLEEIMKD